MDSWRNRIHLHYDDFHREQSCTGLQENQSVSQYLVKMYVFRETQATVGVFLLIQIKFEIQINQLFINAINSWCASQLTQNIFVESVLISRTCNSHDRAVSAVWPLSSLTSVPCLLLTCKRCQPTAPSKAKSTVCSWYLHIMLIQEKSLQCEPVSCDWMHSAIA